MPYLVSLGVWLGVSGLAYAEVVRRLTDRWSGTALTLLAFPGVLLNIGHGQNGFLTAALMGGGVLLLERRPWLAGALFGRSEEHTSELQSLMRISYAVFCLKKKKKTRTSH